MAIREKPNYTLEGLSVAPFTSGKIHIDIPLDVLHPKITCMSKATQVFSDALKECEKTNFPAERQRMLRHSSFNRVPKHVKFLYLAHMGIDPAVNEEEFKYIDAWVHSKEYLIDARAMYYLFTLTQDVIGVTGTTIDETNSFIAAAYSMVKSSLITPDEEIFDKLKDARSVTELTCTLTSAVLKIESWQKRMHLLRRQRDPKIDFRVRDVFSAEQVLRTIMQMKGRFSGFTQRYIFSHGSDMDFSASFKNLFSSMDEYIEELEELEEQIYGGMYVTDETMKKLDSYESKLAELEKGLKKAVEIRIIERNISHMPLPGKLHLFISKNFVAIGRENEHLAILTESQLYESRVLLSELAATIVSLAVRHDLQLAIQYKQTMMSIYHNAILCSYDQANYLTVLQREYELFVSKIGDIGSTNEFAVSDHGPYKGFISLMESFIKRDGKLSIGLMKSLRTLRQFAFDPLTLYNEHYRCFTIVEKPSEEAIKELRQGIRYVIHRHHAMTFNETHPDLQEKAKLLDLEHRQMFENGLFVGTEIFSDLKWDGFGKKGYSELISPIKDSTNIPPDPEIHYRQNHYKQMNASLTREVLYYANREWKQDLVQFKRTIMSGVKQDWPIRLTVKPEQKEGGRTITMECAPVRLANSIIQANALPMSRSFWGSLMGKGFASKLDCMEKALNYAHTAVNAGFGVLFIEIDFAKFGHTVDYDIDKMILEELSDYWGEEWVKYFLNTLRESTLSSGYCNSEVAFKNEKDADGQGMRNAMWQMMLMSIPFGCFGTLYEDVPELSKSHPISPLFFMDDHVLVVVYTKDKSLSLIENSEMIFKKTMPKIEAIYNKFKLQVEGKKTTASPYGFGLLGDIYTLTGITPTPSKGLGTSFRPSKMNSPSIANLIADCNSSVISGVLTGAHPNEAFVTMIYALAHKLICFAPRVFASYHHFIPFLLFIPQEFGGYGLPLPQHLNIGMGFAKDIDSLYFLYLHMTKDSPYRDYITYIWQKALLAGDRNGEQLKKITHNTTLTPLIVSLMSEKLASLYNIDYKSMLKDRDEKVKETLENLKEVPPTLKLALQNLHPVSEFLKKVEKVCESSTARELATKKEVYMCAMLEKTRFAQHIKSMLSFRGNVTYFKVSWPEFLKQMTGSNTHLVLQVPTRFLLYPILPGKAFGNYTMRFRKISGQAPVNFVIGNRPQKQPVDVSPLPTAGEMGRLIDMHNLVYAHTSEYSGNSEYLNKRIQIITNSDYSHDDFLPSGDPVAYRDISTIAYTPSVTAPWVGEISTSYAIEHDDVSPFTEANRTHYNYNMAMLVGYLYMNKSSDFILSRGAMWKSPDISSDIDARNIPKVKRQYKEIYSAVHEVTKNRQRIDHDFYAGERRAKEMFDTILDTMQTEHEISRLYRNVEYVDQDAQPIKDFIHTHQESFDLLEQIAKVMPRDASKILWSAWVTEVYNHLVIRKVPVASILRQFPPKFNSYNVTLADNQEALMQLMPHRSLMTQLDNKAKQIGCYNEMLNWFKRIWVTVIKGPLPTDFRSLELAVRHMILHCPSAYIKQLRLSITMLQTDNIIQMGTAKFQRFCLAWSDRYLAQVIERVDILRNFKKGDATIKPVQGKFASEAHKALYQDIHLYKALACFYRALGMMPESTADADHIAGCVYSAINNLVFKDIHFTKMSKTFRQVDNATLSDFLKMMDKAGNIGKADSYRSMIDKMTQRLTLISEDLNFPIVIDWPGIPISEDLVLDDIQYIVKGKGHKPVVDVDEFVLEYLGTADASLESVGAVKKIHSYSEAELRGISREMKKNTDEVKHKKAIVLARKVKKHTKERDKSGRKHEVKKREREAEQRKKEVVGADLIERIPDVASPTHKMAVIPVANRFDILEVLEIEEQPVTAVEEEKIVTTSQSTDLYAEDFDFEINIPTLSKTTAEQPADEEFDDLFSVSMGNFSSDNASPGEVDEATKEALKEFDL